MTLPTLDPSSATPLDDAARDRAAEAVASLCVAAGATVMAIYERGCAVRAKADRSPVTEADEAAEALILAGLATQFPGWRVVAEEACARSGAPGAARRQIFVDPLDGTREFIGRNGEFTVNVGLVEDGVPVAGAVYAPALGRLWYGGAAARACNAAPGSDLASVRDRQTLRTRRAGPGHWTALASRSHADPQTEAFLGRLPVSDRRAAGSSLKFCVVAEGEADVYPRFGPTMEWDTAAGDAVLRAAGGVVLAADGAPLRYGKAESGYRNGAFVAWGDAQAAAQVPLDGAQASG